MGGINYGRVILGGLLAGLVINVGESISHLFLFAEQSAAIMEGLDLPEPGGRQIATYWILGFVVGIAMIWVYAAIRPRFGPGVATAIKAGVATFALVGIIPTLFESTSGLYAFGSMVPFLIWGLIWYAGAGVAGAWPYTEAEAGV